MGRIADIATGVITAPLWIPGAALYNLHRKVYQGYPGYHDQGCNCGLETLPYMLWPVTGPFIMWDIVKTSAKKTMYRKQFNREKQLCSKVQELEEIQRQLDLLNRIPQTGERLKVCTERAKVLKAEIMELEKVTTHRIFFQKERVNNETNVARLGI